MDPQQPHPLSPAALPHSEKHPSAPLQPPAQLQPSSMQDIRTNEGSIGALTTERPLPEIAQLPSQSESIPAQA